LQLKIMDLFQQNLRLEMVRPELAGLPEWPLPPGYSLRWFQPGDAAHWLRIHHDADPFTEITPDLFTRQFGDDLSVLHDYQCYIEDGAGRVVGTGTAWSANDWPEGACGRVFWPAVLRQYQGRGLGKSLLSVVCHRLQDLGYKQACVYTSTGRLPAVSLYLRLGFQPVKRNETDREIWDRVMVALKARGQEKEAAAAA
jgi:mycothiol synthase